MKVGIRHFVKCRCVLDRDNHQFSVFSVLNDDVVESKLVQCNNCGIVHRVHEISKSLIVPRESLPAALSIDDLKLSLDSKLVLILEKNQIDDVSTWEEAKFIVDNERWGSFIVLVRDRQDGVINVKLLRFMSKGIFVIDSEVCEEVV